MAAVGDGAGEALDDNHSRFNKILSDLRSVDSAYDINYSQSKISRHFLIGLDMYIWEMKVTSIHESIDMSTLTLDSLYTKLKTHEINILSHKVDSKSSALISSSSSLDVGASSSNSTTLTLINAMSDEQLERFEEENLVLAANKISRAMNNVRNRKRGGPTCCFEYGALDHIRSHCPKLGRGKKVTKEDEINKKEKKKSLKQRLIRELIEAFDTDESENEEESKDVDESDSDSEEKLSYHQLEHAAFKFAKILKTCSNMLDEKDHTIEILNAEIDRLKSSIPNDDDCKYCEVLFSEINVLRDVNSVSHKKLESEIEKSKKLESSFALGFALHARVVDELVFTKGFLTKYKVAFCASTLLNFYVQKGLNKIKMFWFLKIVLSAF
uniref:Zinc knuckle family protein n=1 Tax=Oryza sativa subsp. japonica TaxID=39947 RepID=Q2R1E3_ORYSJ|nr:hypothetical protein LOC_Os11g39460 [Oryza sativa Japonica Group]